MIRLKNYSCHNAFNKKNVSPFDVLTFIQMRAVLTYKRYDYYVFDFLKVSKITTNSLSCLKAVNNHLRSRHL